MIPSQDSSDGLSGVWPLLTLSRPLYPTPLVVPCGPNRTDSDEGQRFNEQESFETTTSAHSSCLLAKGKYSN
jgi:hypothetical protein